MNALDCMRKVPAVVLDSSTLEECMNIMRTNHLERIPVADINGHLRGMIEKDHIAKIIF